METQKFPRTLCFDPCSEFTAFITMVSSTRLSEELSVNVAVLCMLGRVSKQNRYASIVRAGEW